MWAAKIDGDGYDYGRGVFSDKNGNLAVTGYDDSTTLIFYDRFGN